MPQLDKLSFISQLIWLLPTLIVLYIFLLRWVLPTIGTILKLRNRLIQDFNFFSKNKEKKVEIALTNNLISPSIVFITNLNKIVTKNQEMENLIILSNKKYNKINDLLKKKLISLYLLNTLSKKI